MSERLRQLQRQQALLREHLAWIDREIVREASASVPSADVADQLHPSAVVTSPQPPVTDADSLLEHYAAEERQNPADIRRGCLIIFFGALLLLASLVTAAWMVFYR